MKTNNLRLLLQTIPTNANPTQLRSWATQQQLYKNYNWWYQAQPILHDYLNTWLQQTQYTQLDSTKTAQTEHYTASATKYNMHTLRVWSNTHNYLRTYSLACAILARPILWSAPLCHVVPALWSCVWSGRQQYNLQLSGLLEPQLQRAVVYPHRCTNALHTQQLLVQQTNTPACRLRRVPAVIELPHSCVTIRSILLQLNCAHPTLVDSTALVNLDVVSEPQPVLVPQLYHAAATQQHYHTV